MLSTAVLAAAVPGTAVVVSVAAALTGWLCSWTARAFARRFRITSAPNPIVPQHRTPVAYLGGLGVAIGAFAVLGPSLALGRLSSEEMHAMRLVAAPAVGFLAIGLWDDLVTLTASRKLLAQVVAAASAVSLGLQAQVTASSWLNWTVSVAWVVLIVNAVNVTDVCDGLVAGIAVVGFATMTAAEPDVRLLAAVMTGSTLGFLLLNRPPASIFLGDAGSHLIGFVLAALGLLHLDGHRTPAAAGLGMLITAVPLFEVVLLVVARRRRGLRVWLGSPDHFSLRLQARGCTRWQANGLAWAVAAGACGLGIGLSHVPRVVGAVGVVALVTAGFLAGRALLAAS